MVDLRGGEGDRERGSADAGMMQREAGPSYLLLFVPYGVAYALSPWPDASFLAAWVGSFGILALTFSGIIKPLPQGKPVMSNVLRPIVLTQLVFVTYTALTSIFTFVDAHGFFYF